MALLVGPLCLVKSIAMARLLCCFMKCYAMALLVGLFCFMKCHVIAQDESSLGPARQVEPLIIPSHNMKQCILWRMHWENSDHSVTAQSVQSLPVTLWTAKNPMRILVDNANSVIWQTIKARIRLRLMRKLKWMFTGGASNKVRFLTLRLYWLNYILLIVKAQTDNTKWHQLLMSNEEVVIDNKHRIYRQLKCDFMGNWYIFRGRTVKVILSPFEKGV